VNVVWIIIDCLRADRLGCYGYNRPTTPHLDRIAREAARFTQCISPHIPTEPAHTSFFAGKDVFSHQIVAQGGKREVEHGLRLLFLVCRDGMVHSSLSIAPLGGGLFDAAATAAIDRLHWGERAVALLFDHQPCLWRSVRIRQDRTSAAV